MYIYNFHLISIVFRKAFETAESRHPAWHCGRYRAKSVVSGISFSPGSYTEEKHAPHTASQVGDGRLGRRSEGTCSWFCAESPAWLI